MINIIDASMLASTKLRTRKVRTSITVAISGILFGLLIAGVTIVQGVFSSAERFSEQGLGDRFIMTVSEDGSVQYDDIDKFTRRADIIAIFEKEHTELVEQKTAEAKRLGIEYSPEFDDPSPVTKEPDTGEKYVDTYSSANSEQNVARLRELMPEKEKFDIKKIAGPYNPISYPSSTIPLEQGMIHMKDGHEPTQKDINNYSSAYPSKQNPYVLALSDSSIMKPFVSAKFDGSKGEIPVVIPYSDAEKLLGLTPLSNTTSATERLSRLYEVRDRIGEVTTSFCYRNDSSRELLEQARAIEKDIKLNQSKPDFVMPTLRYKLPVEDSCGAVEVASDTRSLAEKQYADNLIIFHKKFNNYQDPDQHKIVVRGVGITPDMKSAYSGGTTSSLAASLLSSYAEVYWSIPRDLLDSVDQQYKPSIIFNRDISSVDSSMSPLSGSLVEFGNFQDAQGFYKKYGCSFGSCGSGGAIANPYGSSSLILAEARGFFDTAVRYAVIFVSVFAMIILAGTIGRTIADGRKESAVFRAIGAKRSDLMGIYGVYTLLLAFRVTMFALVLGLLLAWLLDIWQWQNATAGAQLAFGALDKSIEFHFFDIWTPYILLISGSVLVAALLAMIAPILRAMRRDPIQDMRDDN